MQSVKLNLIPGAVLPVVNVSQYDVKRTFQLAVYDGAASYDLTGKTVTIRGTKQDNHGFDYGTSDGVVSVSGNTVTISTTQQMTAVGGQVMAELRIESGTTVIGTLNFIIDVEPSALSDDTIISDTEIPVIERDFEAALAEAEADALVAEGYAKGTQGGVPVESGSPYYNNNAEHFKDEAEAAASGVLEKYPKIVSDYWYIWDVATNQYVNTGVRAKGTQGDPGEGVPAGGTTGQVLKKKSNSDYDTEWADDGGGGASALDDLTDVDITSPTSGQGLLYDGAEWVNGAISGVPSGGTTGQALVKHSATDGDVEWAYRATPEQIEALEATGAANLMPNTAISQVVQGVTFTVNPPGYPDGAIMLSSSAAPTGGIDYQVNSGFKLPAGTYYILPNNYPSTGMNSRISVGVKNGSQIAYDSGFDHTHRSFTLAQETELVYRLYANKDGSIGALNNVVIYPMISRIDGMVYYPYAMTNKELTDAVNTVDDTTVSSLNTNANYTVSQAGHIYRLGKICQFMIQIRCTSAASSWVVALNAGSMPIPKGANPIYINFSDTDGNTPSIAVGIAADGRLILINGVTNHYYNVLITYITN